MIERLIEKTADLAASSVGGLQRMLDLRRGFTPARLLGWIVGAMVRQLGALLFPPQPSLPAPSPHPMTGMLRVLLPGLMSPSSGGLTRRAFSMAFRAAPSAWALARDKRTKVVLAILARVAFGHSRRRLNS